MSLIEDHVHQLDLYLDKIQLRTLEAVQLSSTNQVETFTLAEHLATPPVTQVAGIARALSAGPSSTPVLSASRILALLRRSHGLRSDLEQDASGTYNAYSADLVWMVAAKATVQIYAIVVNVLLEDSSPLTKDIWYWDEVLGSYLNSGLYAIQTSPLRFGNRIMDVFQRARQCQPMWRQGLDSSTLSTRWAAFYNLVRDSARQQSMAQAKQVFLSPFQLCRSEARRSRRSLRKMRELNACAVGLLMEEALLFDFDEEDTNTNVTSSNPEDWQDTVYRTTSLMRTILKNVNDLSNDFTGFEENVFASLDTIEPSYTGEETQQSSFHQPFHVIQQLIGILEELLPRQRDLSRDLIGQYGRPSRIVRYWLPASALVLSSSTLFKMLANRRAEILTWIREVGNTVKDFWMNWVIEPLNQLVGIIRHDEKSEVALMSKGSLKSDLESLERMVVDYATRHPDRGLDRPFTPAELGQIRSGVKEGDLTLVLKAYERDLQTPLMGAIRGDLITTLLIQIQKTKVDVEVAMSGIDSLLKSQQLVFGFIGLTPGILVSYSAITWVANAFGSRRGLRRGQYREEARRSLRAVNRILASSVPTPSGVLSYKDHGLLVCEAEILRGRARDVLPGHIYHEFFEDLTDLLNFRTGIAQQLRVLDQIRWAYSKWI